MLKIACLIDFLFYPYVAKLLLYYICGRGDCETRNMRTKCEEKFHLLRMNVKKVILTMKLSINMTTLTNSYRRGDDDFLECNLKCKIKKKKIVNS